MSGGITVKEFKYVPGVNDAEYIKKLEELREIDKGIINTAVAKIKRLSAELKERPEIIRCKDCKHYDWDIVDAPYGLAQKICWCNRLFDCDGESLRLIPNYFCSWAEKRGEENA